MTNNGFKINSTDKYDIRLDLEDKFLYCGRQNSELYFDDQIRHGISSFSSLANQIEVEQGQSQLRIELITEESKTLLNLMKMI